MGREEETDTCSRHTQSKTLCKAERSVLKKPKPDLSLRAGSFSLWSDLGLLSLKKTGMLMGSQLLFNHVLSSPKLVGTNHQQRAPKEGREAHKALVLSCQAFASGQEDGEEAGHLESAPCLLVMAPFPMSNS